MGRGCNIGTTEHTVFVYGTLLRGEYNHGLISGARHLGEASTEAGFELYDFGPFPAMVAGGTGTVAGEVYAVDASTLAALDRLESTPESYRRLWIRLASGVDVEAYLLEHEQVRGHPRIPCGDWRQRDSRDSNVPASGSIE